MNQSKWLITWGIGYNEQSKEFTGFRFQAKNEAYKMWIDAGNLNAMYDVRKIK